jgi:hypothetical protein
MSEVLRLVLLLTLSATAVTLGVAIGARLLAEDMRLRRAFRKGLRTRPDAHLIAHGSGRGVAISLAAQSIVTAWDNGGWLMVYPVDELLGAELDLDGEVTARTVRGEPRRMLDRTGAADREVRLRFLFDDPRNPDFDLVLWPSSARRGGHARPREAIAEANRWIARIEAVLRRSGGALVLGKAPSVPPPRPRPAAKAPEADLFEDDEIDEDDFDEDELAD